MRKLLNTLYVMTETAYLSLEGQNVVVQADDNVLARIPLHGLESVISFSYKGASPAVMGACAQNNIDLCFLKPNGRFLARVVGRIQGNVLLRKAQFKAAEENNTALGICKNMILGKVYNSRWVLERATRDHTLSVDSERLKKASMRLKDSIGRIQEASSIDTVRGIEGDAAAEYFGVFNELILRGEEAFVFHGRTKRPPEDRINAMLSFAYSLLAGNCTSALETVGLDAYVGFLHTIRPGRASLALDLMEELRPVIADRFVITCVNNRIITEDMFEISDNGAVMMNDTGRKLFLQAWQQRKKESIKHPYLQEKVPWGLVPYLQALLLARFLRGDLDAYPPFLWK